MVLYNAFLTFVELNITVTSTHSIRFGSDRYLVQQKLQYQADTDTEYWVGASLIIIIIF